MKEDNIKKGEETYDMLSSLFNGNYSGQEAFVGQFMKEFSTDHRTLQQNILRGFFHMMKEASDRHDKGLVDARNEASFKACKVMVEAYKKEFGFYPNEGMPVI